MAKLLKKYSLWLGDYHLGQGYHGPTKPELVAMVKAIDFKTACYKYELQSKYRRLIEGEIKDDLNSQDYHFYYDPTKLINSWTGKYYETKDEAWTSFYRGQDTCPKCKGYLFKTMLTSLPPQTRIECTKCKIVFRDE